MTYFTERHGMRKPIERTSTISPEMYALLFDCCEKYLDNLAWKFPEECLDGRGCCGLDRDKFHNMLKFEIPTLYRNSQDRIDKPCSGYYNQNEQYDPYALLDFIEYLGHNCRDISIGDYHSYFGHHHIDLFETSNVFEVYRTDINGIFEKTGLLYTLTTDKIVERVLEHGVLTAEIEAAVKTIKEPGTKELLEAAIRLFKHHNPATRNFAVEKIWDAFERLKTYYVNLDKKGSSGKIVSDMSNGQPAFMIVFDDEFKALTKIGNDFRIRHHEINKIDITDLRHYDYFFNRCLSLVSSALLFLQ